MITIRNATIDDKPAIVKIWRANTAMLGGVIMQSINKSIAAQQLHVAMIDGNIVGFVEYHQRRDGWQTVYHIVVAVEYRNQHIGSLLIDSVPFPIRLKVTADNEQAIRFYEQKRFRPVAIEVTKTGRQLYVFELE